MQRKKTPAIDRMLVRKVVDSDGCWIWPGAKTGVSAAHGGGGYGQIRVGDKILMTHRVSFEHFVRPLDPGEVVDHRCHREDSDCPGLNCKHRLCWNPSHLQATTRAENSTAGVSPNMRTFRTGVCKRDHVLTDDNVVIWIRPSGTAMRQCKTCARDSQRRRRSAA